MAFGGVVFIAGDGDVLACGAVCDSSSAVEGLRGWCSLSLCFGCWCGLVCLWVCSFFLGGLGGGVLRRGRVGWFKGEEERLRRLREHRRIIFLDE